MHCVIGAEQMIGKKGVWTRTHFRRRGPHLLSTTYLVADGNPQVLSLRLDLRPLARFVTRLHRQLHAEEGLTVGSKVGFEPTAITERAMRLGRSRLAATIARNVKAVAKTPSSGAAGASLSTLPATSGVGLAATAAYAAADATVRALENGKRLRDEARALQMRIRQGERARAALEAQASHPAIGISLKAIGRGVLAVSTGGLSEVGFNAKAIVAAAPKVKAAFETGPLSYVFPTVPLLWGKGPMAELGKKFGMGPAGASLLAKADSALQIGQLATMVKEKGAEIFRGGKDVSRDVVTEAKKIADQYEVTKRAAARGDAAARRSLAALKEAAELRAKAKIPRGGSLAGSKDAPFQLRVTPEAAAKVTKLAIARVMAAKKAALSPTKILTSSQAKAQARARARAAALKANAARLAAARAANPSTWPANVPRTGKWTGSQFLSWLRYYETGKRARIHAVTGAQRKSMVAYANRLRKAHGLGTVGESTMVNWSRQLSTTAPPPAAATSKAASKNSMNAEMRKSRWTEADFRNYLRHHLVVYPTSDPRKVSGTAAEKVIATHNSRRASKGLAKKSLADYRHFAAHLVWPTAATAQQLSLAAARNAAALKKKLADPTVRAQALLVKKRADAARAEVERIRQKALTATGSERLDAVKNAAIVNLAAQNRARARAMATEHEGGLPGMLVDSRGRIRPGRFRVVARPPGLNPSLLYQGPGKPAPRGPFEQIAGMPAISGMPPWMPPLTQNEQGRRAGEIQKWFAQNTRSPQSLLEDAASPITVGCDDDPRCGC